jgi:hypothetical protein
MTLVRTSRRACMYTVGRKKQFPSSPPLHASSRQVSLSIDSKRHVVVTVVPSSISLLRYSHCMTDSRPTPCAFWLVAFASRLVDASTSGAVCGCVTRA